MQRRSRLNHLLRILVAVLLISAVGVAVFGYHEATRDPVVRRLTLHDADWPRGAPPMRILLMSDLHALGPAAGTDRLKRIVAQANSLRPDVVVLAGDFVASGQFAPEHPDIRKAVQPLRMLRPRIGSFAVVGNNDRDDSVETGDALREAGVTLLQDDAVQLGPLALGGVDTRIRTTARHLLALDGLKIVVAHTPDLFPRVPEGIPLMLAGHTHCGQIVLPWIGAISTGSHFGTRYLCGVRREGAKNLIVTAGIGTSKVPIRIGAPPDMWLITVGR
jgi:predicted MPP superfamily phosphohydrolase